MTRKDISGSGGAAATTLNGTLAQGGTSFIITSATGWPSGGTYPFEVVIDRGNSEEKILCQSRSGTTVTVATSGRGYDSTTDAQHLSGTSVEVCVTAITIGEANLHVNDTSRDDHTQYHTPARHAAVSHDASMLASNAVTTVKILDANVTASKLASTAVTPGSYGSASSVPAITVDQQGRITAASTNAIVSTYTIAAGTPSNPPASTGLQYYDSTNNLFYVANSTPKWVCITPQNAQVTALEARSNATMGDCATAGPAVTVFTGTKALATLSVILLPQNTYMYMDIAVSGATTIAATADQYGLECVVAAVSQSFAASSTRLITGLNAGSNTFTAKYAASNGSYYARSLTVVGIP